MFVIGAVYLLRSRRQWPEHRRTALALARWGSVFACGRRVPGLPVVGQGRLGSGRSGSQVVHKWQYRVRIIYQQVLGPLLTGLTLLVAVWSVPHVYGSSSTKFGGL